MCSCNKARRVAPGPGPGPGPSPAVAGPKQQLRPAPRAVVTVAPVIPDISIPTVDTSVWGAALWRILHTATVATRSRAQIVLWRNVIDALKTGLPCPECSAHYNAWVSHHGLRFSLIGDGIRGPVVRWFLELHNYVNRRNDVAGGTWTAKQVMETYGGAARVAEATATLESLRGIIGDGAWNAIAALLKSL